MASAPAAPARSPASSCSASALPGASPGSAEDAVRLLLVSANQERSPDPVAPLRVCYVAAARGVGGVAFWDGGTGAVTVTPPAWLPSLDVLRAERRWIDNRLYFERGGMANLQTKRGCHYKCTFCAYPVIEGRGMRTRDPG